MKKKKDTYSNSFNKESLKYDIAIFISGVGTIAGLIYLIFFAR